MKAAFGWRHAGVLALLLGSASCATLGGHVKGSFACKAPQGTCEPLSSIDRRAVASLGGSAAEPVSTGSIDGNLQLVDGGYGGGEPARTGDHVLKVVFPAHSDGNGIWHEESVAHFVSEPARWVEQPAAPPGALDATIAADAPSATPRVSTPGDGPSLASAYSRPGAATSVMPLTMREAAAGLEVRQAQQSEAPLPAVLPDDLTREPLGGADSAPSAAAIAAARAGHRIGQLLTTKAAAPRSRSAAGPVRAPGTRALNRDALARLTAAREQASPAPSRPSDVGPIMVRGANDIVQPGPVSGVADQEARP